MRCVGVIVYALTGKTVSLVRVVTAEPKILSILKERLITYTCKVCIGRSVYRVVRSRTGPSVPSTVAYVIR